MTSGAIRSKIGLAVSVFLGYEVLGAQTVTPVALGSSAQRSSTGQSTTPAVSAAIATPPAKPRITCDALGPAADWNEATQFIAGLSNKAFEQDLEPEQRTAWNSFSRAARSDWTRLQRGYLEPVANWRSKAFSAKSGGVAFYPFSGPDAANLLTFYPEAREYVLIGLEPAGCLPPLVENYSADYFTALRDSLRSAIALGFFKTNEMRQQFRESEVSGVLPVLLAEMARSGFSIVDVGAVAITPDGATLPLESAPKREARGVAIQFKDDRHGVRTLRYLSLNLENASLARKPGTMKYLQSLEVSGTLVKSASYLMHKRAFSTVRGVILGKSGVLVQDDSGIPFQFFDSPNWNVQLYGTYSSPIRLFRNSHQPDLEAAYMTRKDIQPLDFGFGYRFKLHESNLLIASRRR